MNPPSQETSPQNTPATSTPPSVTSVSEYLLYGLSIPERTLRSTSAALGGAVRESAALLVPQAFRSSKSYSMFIEQMLDFLAHDVGGVEKAKSGADENEQIENFVARKAVGGFIELASLPLLHVSPMAVLAIVSDVAYGSQSYLKEFSDELKKQGVIDEKTTIDDVTDLLEAVKQTTSTAAEAVDTPPLSVEGLSQTIQQVRQAATSLDPTKLLPRAEVERLWTDMHEMATREKRSVMDISSAMTMYSMNQVGALGTGALSTITVAGNMFDRHIFEHYATALSEINEKGFYAILAESSKPYVSAMWQNFSTDRETITEDLFTGRMIGRAWNSVHAWFGGDKK